MPKKLRRGQTFLARTGFFEGWVACFNLPPIFINSFVAMCNRGTESTHPSLLAFLSIPFFGSPLSTGRASHFCQAMKWHIDLAVRRMAAMGVPRVSGQNILWIMKCQVRDILHVHWLLILSGWIRTQLAWGIPGTRGLDHFLRCPHMEWRGQQQPRSRGVFFGESQGKPDGFLVWVSGESLRCWVSANKGPRRIQTWQAQQKRNGLEWLCRICVS